MNSTSHSNDPYRVAYLSRSADEVVRRDLDRLIRLRDEGFEVHVLAGPGEGLQSLKDRGFITRKIPVRRSGNPAALAGAYFIVQAHLIENPPVLVHSVGHRLAWLGTYAARQVKVPAIFSTLEYHWLEEDPLHLPLGPMAQLGTPDAIEGAEQLLNAAVGPSYRQWMRRAYRWLGEEVDKYVVTTEFDFQLVQDAQLVPVEKLEIAVGSPGVDLEKYSLTEPGPPDRRQARDRLGLPGHWRQVVGWVGPVTRRHGADDLVEAIEKLRRSHPSVGWIIAPRDRLAAGQRRRLERLQRRGQVQLIDDRVAGADLYEAMDLLMWLGRPSTPHDAIGEAAAMAVPTVGFDTPGARSIIDAGQTGHLVYGEQLPTLVATAEKMLDDPSYLHEMGWRARSRVARRFSRRDVDEQLLGLYDAVLGQKL